MSESTVNEARNEGGSITVALPEWGTLTVPEIQRALRVKRMFLKYMAALPFMSGLIEQIGKWETSGNRDFLRRAIMANVREIEHLARQGE